MVLLRFLMVHWILIKILKVFSTQKMLGAKLEEDKDLVKISHGRLSKMKSDLVKIQGFQPEIELCKRKNQNASRKYRITSKN